MGRTVVLLTLLAGGCSFSGLAGGDNGIGDGDGDGDGGIDAGDGDGDAGMDAGVFWYDTTFRSRRPIEIDNRGRLGLEGFPVPIELVGLGKNKVEEDGGGLRFVASDHVTELPFEIEEWDQDAGLVWVRVDLPSDASAEIFVYYDLDGPRSANEGGGDQVFAGFFGAYHFADPFESGDGSEDALGENDLDEVNNLDSGDDQKGGAFASGVEYDAEDSQFFATTEVVPSFLIGDDEARLFEIWLRSDELDDETAFTALATESGCQGVSLSVAPPDRRLRAAVALGSNCQGGRDDYVLRSADRIDDNDWHHAALLVDRDAGTATLWIDGIEEDEEDGLPNAGNTGGDALRIGNDHDDDRFFTGRLDEVRVGPARPADWVEATAAGTELVAVGAEQRVTTTGLSSP